MAANARIHRAVVHAGTTADAFEGFTQFFVGISLGATVVQQNQVHFFGAVFFTGLARAADQVEVGGDRLTGGRARQQAVQRRHMLQLFHHFFNAGDGDMHLGHGGAHATVAFVFHQAQGAGFGHAKVDARQADVGIGKLAPQHLATNANQGINVFGIGHARNFFGKQLGNGLFGLVDGRHDDVRRRLTGQLHDVLTHVGFQRLDTGCLHGVVEAHLFAHHRLALDDAFGLDPLGNTEGNGVGFIGVLRPVHLDAVGGEPGLKLLQQARQVGQAVAANLRTQFAQALQLFFIRKLGAPFGLQKVHGAAKILALPRVVEHAAAALLEVFHRVDLDDLAHAAAPGWAGAA